MPTLLGDGDLGSVLAVQRDSGHGAQRHGSYAEGGPIPTAAATLALRPRRWRLFS